MEGKPRKAGKARPLLVLAVPAIAVAIIALFMAPNPYNGQGVYNPDVLIWTLIVVAIGYNLFYAFAWPLYYTSHSAMVNLSTRNATQRSLLGTMSMAAQVGAAGVAGMAGGYAGDAAAEAIYGEREPPAVGGRITAYQFPVFQLSVADRDGHHDGG